MTTSDLANAPCLIIDQCKRGFAIAIACGLTRRAAAHLVNGSIGKPRQPFTLIHNVGSIG